MAKDCIFCNIVAGVIPVRRVHEDPLCLAFPDINPQAPTHLLLVPKEHIPSLAHTTPNQAALLGHLLAIATQVAEKQQLSQGYRLVANTGPDGGQTVDHLHLHLLGGRPLSWPPG